MDTKTKKFTVLKPVLHGDKLTPKAETIELAEGASTKHLLKSGHIEEVKPAAKEATDPKGPPK